MTKVKKCDKRCPYYSNGMCFKEARNVKIIKTGDKCKWDRK